MKVGKTSQIIQNTRKYNLQKIMKQAISTLLATVLILGLSGCGGGDIQSSLGSGLSESATTNNYKNINLNDYAALTKEYLEPVALSGITADSWSSAEEIPHGLALFYIVKRMLTNSSETIDWYAAPYSSEDVESFVKNYFDVTLEKIRNSEYYDEGDSVYSFTGVGSSVSFKVVDAELDGQKLLLHYEYYSPADDVTVIRKGVLTIMLGEHSYKYVSCLTD